jgi:UDP-galactopyranose mutase
MNQSYGLLPSSTSGHSIPLVVFCHLRWKFVFQRPQHIMWRMAQHRPVYFVEEPIASEDGQVAWEFDRPAANITVCRARTPAAEPGFVNCQLEFLEPLLDQLIADEHLEKSVAWVYSPMATPLLKRLRPQAIVYDCMDELSAFLNAPRELLDRERDLLQLADLVFTGGRSLYRAKCDRHPHVCCFPSSVDAKHFAQAKSREIEADDQHPLPHPRLGYFGVIDERIDLELLAGIADRRPDWQLVMVGPVVKIDPATLPQRPNIRYVGQVAYERLPNYLAGWDVCLLPFARNDATRFISPTKTLEYMAAERPIVSTPITDVAEPYGSFVYLAETIDDFVRACETALAAGSEERERRFAEMRRVLAGTSGTGPSRR